MKMYFLYKQGAYFIDNINRHLIILNIVKIWVMTVRFILNLYSRGWLAQLHVGKLLKIFSLISALYMQELS
jgi:hypothetical protein